MCTDTIPEAGAAVVVDDDATPALTVVSLARMYYPVRVLGPGRRVGIWLTGCDLHCRGCISPELKRYNPSREITVDDILRMVRRISAPVDGFTISGGEPFYRPAALAALVTSLSEVNDDILIFTGYRLEALRARRDRSVDTVLATCAALVDGPYVQALDDGRGIRGSSNQRCWVFRHPERYEGFATAERRVQTVVYGGRAVTFGIPPHRPENINPHVNPSDAAEAIDMDETMKGAER